MAAIGASRTLPLLRGVREHASAQGVSLRGPADLAMGSEAAQSESQGDLGAHDAPGKAMAPTGTYLSPLRIAEHGRHDSRQEPGAVVRHAGIRGGGAPKGVSLRRQPVASNAAVGLGERPARPSKGESQAAETARGRVPRRGTGTDRRVVATKPGNAGGAKAAGCSGSFGGQPPRGGRSR